MSNQEIPKQEVHVDNPASETLLGLTDEQKAELEGLKQAAQAPVEQAPSAPAVSPELARVKQEYAAYEAKLSEARSIADPTERSEAIARSLAILDELREERRVLDGSIPAITRFQKDAEIVFPFEGKKLLLRMTAERQSPTTGAAEIQVEGFDRSKPDPADWKLIRFWAPADELLQGANQSKKESAILKGPGSSSVAA